MPATAIAWGAWADIGAGAGVAQRGDVAMIKPEDGAYAFRALLRHDRGYTGYLPLTRMPLLTALAARTPFAESFRDSVHPGGETPSVLAELTGLPEDEWPDRLRRLIVDQARGGAMALVFCTHWFDIVRSDCTRVIGLRDGRLLFDAPPAEVDEARLAQLYAGSDERL